jgi:tetratricopeptide (TPR) repeat protein
MGWEAETEITPLTLEQEQELWAVIRARAPGDLAEFEAAETDEDLFYALPNAAMAAWHLEQFDYAKTIAEKTLALAPANQENWNFGNAINFAHSVIGLLALRDGQIQTAIQELHKAGKTPGSPQLDSFGPSMQLARALAKHGELEAALEYIQQCRLFWKSGEIWLDLWEAKLRSREVPNFFWGGFR